VTRRICSIGRAKWDDMEQARRRRRILAPRIRSIGGERKGERSGEKEERWTTVCPRSSLPRWRPGQGRWRDWWRRGVVWRMWRQAGLVVASCCAWLTHEAYDEGFPSISFTSRILAYCLFSFAPFYLHVYTLFLSFTFASRILFYSLFLFAPFHLLLWWARFRTRRQMKIPNVCRTKKVYIFYSF
jgi:hypothetical protein